MDLNSMAFSYCPVPTFCDCCVLFVVGRSHAFKILKRCRCMYAIVKQWLS